MDLEKPRVTSYGTKNEGNFGIPEETTLGVS